MTGWSVDVNEPEMITGVVTGEPAADTAIGMTITATTAITRPNAKILCFIFFSLYFYVPK
jgi:hypothetical protein